MTDPDKYQVGVHDIDTTGTIADESDVVEFEMETETVFKRLADDIYETPEAGIREPLMNAITSVRRAFDGNTDEGVIQITVKKGQQVTLSIRDNGLGITNEVLEDVLTVIGRSGVRDDGKLAGQYGMGFLASYKLVGSDGGFFMDTNPRDGERYKGMFRPGAFERDTEGRFPDLLVDNEHGTAFEYHVKESVSYEDLREWVEKHAKWSPVPVMYTELNKDGDVIFNEDFGYTSLSDRYSTWVTVENEYFEAVASPDAGGEAILISSPMSMNRKMSLWKNIPWKVDLRLKYENGIIVDGPHEGLAPVTKEEYKSMSEDRKERYMPEKQMSPNDVCLPQPIGTREKLDSNSDFLEHVRSMINQNVKENIAEVASEFDPVSDNYKSLRTDQTGSVNMLADAYEKEALRSFIKKSGSHKSTVRNLAKKLDSITDNVSVDKDDEVVDFIARISEETRRVHPDKKKLPLHTLAESSDEYDKTFACVSSSTWKTDAVKKSSEDMRVVKVPRSSWYSRVEEYFNWEPLKSLDKSRVQKELGLSESEISDIRDRKSSNTPVKKKNLKIRMGGRHSLTLEAKEVKDKCEDTVSFDNSRYLILFPRGSDRNVSDNKKLANYSVAVAACSSDVYDYLADDCDNIMHYEEYESLISSQTVKTSRGEVKISNLGDYENTILCSTGEYDDIQDWQRILSNVSDHIAKESDKYTKDQLILASVESEDWTNISTLNYLQGFLDEVSRIGYPNNRRYRYSALGRTKRVNLLEAYAKQKLDERQKDSGIIEIVSMKFDGLSKKSVEFVDTMSKVSGSNQSENDSSTSKLPQHQTADGPMSIREIYENHDPRSVLLHVVGPDYMDSFQNTSFIRMANDNLAGQVLITDKFRIPNDVFYVPVVSTVFSQIEDEVSSESKVVGYTGGKNNPYGADEEDWFNLCTYANVKLHNWSNSEVSNLVHGIPFDKGLRFVDNLRELHEEGESPPSVPDNSTRNRRNNSTHIGIM